MQTTQLTEPGLIKGLRTFLRRRLPGEIAADDLLQDIFVKALQTEASGKQINNPVGWLYAAARTTITDYYRQRQYSTIELDDTITSNENEDLKLHAELADCLMNYVEELPTLYRDTLIATDIKGQTMRTVADQFGLSISAIKSRTSRARHMLKEQLLLCCHIEQNQGIVTDFYLHNTACPCRIGNQVD